MNCGPLSTRSLVTASFCKKTQTLSGDAQREKDLSQIRAAGKHLLSLVTDILDITRIEADEMELQIGDFPVARLIEDVAATAAPLAQANGNQLADARRCRNVGSMTSDQLRLRQAAINLMSNAAKFTSNGLVELSARRLRLDHGDWIEIEVRDTGIGIARDDLKTIFQDYKRVNSAEARKREGTGLGLALSQKLCMMMGGNIFVDSELGHGSRFTIRVPAILDARRRARRATQIRRAAPPRRGVRRGKKATPMTGFAHLASTARRAAVDERAPPSARLLIVDGAADNSRGAVGPVCRGPDSRSSRSDCSSEALRLIQEQTFDVVLLDVTLTDMNGTEIVRRIREKFSGLPSAGHHGDPRPTRKASWRP